MTKMSNKNVRILVQPRPYAESPNAWHILYLKGQSEGSYYLGAWFPKSQCKYEQPDDPFGQGVLELPEWLFKKLADYEKATKEKPA